MVKGSHFEWNRWALVGKNSRRELFILINFFSVSAKKVCLRTIAWLIVCAVQCYRAAGQVWQMHLSAAAVIEELNFKF